MSGERKHLSCPSAQPDMEDARVFGLVGGAPDAPQIAYLKAGAAPTDEDLRRLGPLHPTQVFRFAGRCEEHRCAQYADGICGLGARIAVMLAPVVDAPPSCQIRDTCRWHAEQGLAACLRCPQVVTSVPDAQSALAQAADPRAAPKDRS